MTNLTSPPSTRNPVRAICPAPAGGHASRRAGATRPTPALPVVILSGLLLAALPACGLLGREPPERKTPPVAVPESFTSTGEAEVPDRWWKTFEDAELDRLVTEALGRNLDLKVAWDRLDQAAALARQAGAAEWPTLDAVGGFVTSRARTRSPLTGDADTATARDYLLGLTAAYEVDLWGRVRATRKAAELDVHATESDVVATAMLLAAQVATTWYQLVQQQASLDLLEEQRKVSRTLLDLVEVRFKQGAVSAVDVFQQRRQLEAVKAEIPLASMRSSLLEHQLAVLLGHPPARRVVEPARVIPGLPARPATGLPAALVQRRPDLRSAFARLAAADQRTAAAVANRLPALQLTGRLETGGSNTRDLFQLWLASLAANLTAPLLDGGRRAAEVDRTRAVASERLHQYGQAVLTAFQEVEDAMVQELVGLAREELKRSRERYLNGATDYLPVLAAIQALQLLERQLLEEERKLVEYRIDLYRALGGGWELERPRNDTLAAADADRVRPRAGDPATNRGK
jgi:NodT family efflux transporter outer membrane factor (OMF) lipoprotein